LQLTPDVILTGEAAPLAELLQVTRQVPIVFTLVADPVGAGFVQSLARPGGNATGFTALEYGFGAKYLELLKEIDPGVTRTAVVRDASISVGIGLLQVAAFAPPQLLQRLPKRDHAGVRFRIALGLSMKHSEPSHPNALLSTRRKRPRRRRAAEQRD
jgi:ABC transporter substrate binding protein